MMRSLSLAAAALLAGNAVAADPALSSFHITQPSSSTPFNGELYPATVNVTLAYKMQPLNLILEKNLDLFSPNYEMIVMDGDEIVHRSGKTEEEICHYRGHVEGLEGSDVIVALCDTLGLRGQISLGGGLDELYVQPLASLPSLDTVLDVAPRENIRFWEDAHAVFPVSSVLEDKQLPLLVEDPDVPLPPASQAAIDHELSMAAHLEAKGLRQDKVNDFVTVSDELRRRTFNSDSANADHDALITSLCQGRYDVSEHRFSPYRIVVRIDTQVVWQSNPPNVQPSSSGSVYLSRFRDWKRANMPEKDNAHLNTHVNMNCAGIAYLTVMCQPGSVAVNALTSFNADPNRGYVKSHEMGHNFAMPHTNDRPGGGCDSQCTACSMTSGASFTGSPCFAQASANSFKNALPQFTCL